MSIFAIEEADAIIEATGISPLPAAASRLMGVLNQEMPLLVQRLKLGPTPGSTEIIEDTWKVTKKIHDMLGRIGAPVAPAYDLSAELPSPKWSPAIAALIKEGGANADPDPAQRIADAVQQLQWLSDELHRLRGRKLGRPISDNARSYSSDRKAAVKEFSNQLLTIYPKLFGEVPRAIKTPDARTPARTHGNGVNFITNSLAAVTRKMRLAGLTDLADDPAMKISPNTIARWIYKK